MQKIKIKLGGGQIGFTGALTLAFIVLKLCGVINWSWVWVLSPMWISLVITLVIFAVLMIIFYLKD